MALTVGFDATPAVRQAAGIGRYTRQLLAALGRQADDTRYRLFYSSGGRTEGRLPPLDGRFRTRSLPVSDRVLNLVWHRLRLPIPVQLALGRIDVFHSPDFALPPARGVPSVLTVHDLAFLTLPDAAYPTLRVYLERVVPRSARRATRIIAVSERTRQDVLDYLELPEDRVCTVYEGVDPVFRLAGDPALARTQVRSLGVDQPYILTVGTLQPRKNYPRLLEVYARLRRRGLRHRLVIAGARGWMDDPIFRSIDDLHLRDHVTVVRPSDASLVALYQAADAFIYPSLYEGFGLPPLEAMACGVPVACSRASSLPEVAGDAALLFDPTDPEGMEEALRNVLQDDDLRAELRRRGLAQAARFSWDRAAQETVRVYQEAACYA